MNNLLNEHILRYVPQKKIEYDFNLQEHFSIAYKLSKSPSLLTPKLISTFGDIFVIEDKDIENFEAASFYYRESSIFQTCSNTKILEANLKISKKHLPKGLINDLSHTTIPFGKLLTEYKINAGVKDLNICIHKSVVNSSTRIGRNLKIYDKQSNMVIAFVRELFVSEKELSRATLYINP